MAVVKGGTSYTVDQSFDGIVQCKLCRFRHERADGLLECRRMPPHSQGWDGTFWPQVNLADWCGEFRPRVQDSQHDPVASGLRRAMSLMSEGD